MTSLMLVLFAVAFSTAQKAPAAKMTSKSKTTTVATKAPVAVTTKTSAKTTTTTAPVAVTTKTTTTAKVKKDGTPDMRFKENKEAKVVAGPKKKDGTPDMRYKENKKK